jgi:hypothetical protein
VGIGWKKGVDSRRFSQRGILQPLARGSQQNQGCQGSKGLLGIETLISPEWTRRLNGYKGSKGLLRIETCIRP